MQIRGHNLDSMPYEVQVNCFTVSVINPVQSEHTFSEMRYSYHVAPGKCRSRVQVSATIPAVKTGARLESMPVRERLEQHTCSS